MAFELATEVELDAVTIFYGANPSPLEKISKIRGAILGIYAGEDRNIDAGLPDLLKAIVEYKKDLELKIYPGTQHAFFNDRGPVYNKDAAEDASSQGGSHESRMFFSLDRTPRKCGKR